MKFLAGLPSRKLTLLTEKVFGEQEQDLKIVLGI